MTVLAETKWGDVHLYKSVIDRSMTVSAETKWGDVHLYKIVIDRSMTILKQPSKNVIDQTMTIFARIRNGLSQKIVIDRSMTILADTLVGCAVLLKVSLTGQ